MREILFRSKAKDDGKWVYGYIYKIWENAFILWGMVNEVPDMIEIDPKTICEYSGLTDKEGKKIFDGDIVKAPFLCGGRKKNMTGIVEYKKGIFYFKHGEEEFGRQLLGYVDDVEVIGNIFDNPELLTED